jgi:tetratricopeptide (TPR) repeat protein
MANKHIRLRTLSAPAIVCLAFIATARGAALESQPEAAAKIVVQIQRADYEGDRAKLSRLYEEMGRFVDVKDKHVAAKVRYWRGFALWRRALNGFNESADPGELQQDLTQAVSEFDAAGAMDPGLVDAKVGAASCLANLAVLAYKAGKPALPMLEKSNALLKDAEAAEPDNPRLFWVLGANKWYAPPERGGGHTAAIETYQKGLKAVAGRKAASGDVLTPAWGEPELLMNLAWANLHQSPPDLSAAEHYARAALERVPYWHYVRDILLPDIEKRKKAANP